MKRLKDQGPWPAALRPFNRTYQMPPKDSGNTLLYILVLLVIFSVLGVSMVSLFTTSTTSSATPNDARSALYMAESGMRYAMTRLRKSGFSQSTVDDLNSLTYTIDNGGHFTLNEDGSEKWISARTGGDVQSSPTVDDRGTASPADDIIYVASNSDSLHAFNSSGSQLWAFDTGGNVKTKPAVGPTGMVYVGSEGSAGGLLYALAGNFAQPKNERGTFISYSDEFRIDSDPDPTPQDEQDDWLTYNDYAVRLEVIRSLTPATPSGKYEYTLHAWARRCEFADCTDADITGTDVFFQDTRIQYDWFPAPNSFMKQTIKLEPGDHEKLERILFGFTGATGSAGAQKAFIKKFQLSFIRPNDPIVTNDSANYPEVTP